MNGLELIREVRKIENYKHIPILFLTTETQIAIKKEAKESGATGWIVKPFDFDKLLATIHKVLR
jgi:two-component system chemotaxis response regulator CheY